MAQVISIFNNLARTKGPIAVRRLNNFERRQLLGNLGSGLIGSISDTPITTITEGGFTATPSHTTTNTTTNSSTPTTTNTPPTTPQPIITTTVSLVVVSTTQSDPTPTPAPSQKHDDRIPLIVQMGEVRSIFGIHIPQPRPMIGGTPREQQPSSSETVDRSLPRQVAMKQHAQRDQQPVSILLPQGGQQSSSQYNHARNEDLTIVEAMEPGLYERTPPLNFDHHTRSTVVGKYLPVVRVKDRSAGAYNTVFRNKSKQNETDNKYTQHQRSFTLHFATTLGKLVNFELVSHPVPSPSVHVPQSSLIAIPHSKHEPLEDVKKRITSSDDRAYPTSACQLSQQESPSSVLQIGPWPKDGFQNQGIEKW
ncbi:hypothetical protein M378DRAFT_177538 [Amanita muscaria Koide BX008]|uniref:Uncharacterized protein n=1 Tax=Amanita muscaria (strain Koide BX008) TaxID=946122 RepID=A0A0C2XE00_AMAMK|nr:hypothetical protein M378DRAFT_177538 [Amanita muscaria Koide BX008]